MRCHPTRRVLDICEQLLFFFLAKTGAQASDQVGVDVDFSQMTQGLNDETADSAGSGHLAWRGPLQNDLPGTNPDPSRRARREEHRFHRHLLRQPE